MNRPLLPLLVLAFSAAAAFSQVPRVTPTPSPDEDVVKITTSLIQIDVTVTDSRGRVISDIRPEELEIYENGKKQKISNFSFVSNVRERVEEPAKIDRRAPVVPTPPLKEENVRRTIALVVDDLTLSFESTYWVRRALKKFVDEQMQEGDLVAIIRAGAGIGALQQFTSDKRMLYAAIERIKWNPSGAGGVTAFAPIDPFVRTGNEGDEPEAGERTPEGRDREFNDFRTNYFVTGTLGAVNYVVRGMSELPGRKSIMLLSDGFRLFNRDASGTVEFSRIMGSLRSLIDQANRSSVVIYTLDPRGLQYTGLTAADNTSQRSTEEVQQELDSRASDFRDTQDGLVYLARQTGGFALINNNDLSGGIRRVLDDHSYYLVAYEPDEETFDPKLRRFNRLDIKVLRKGARVRYRSGFFGVSDDTGAPSTRSPKGDILYALTSPFATNEIPVRLNSLFGVQADKTSYIRSLLHIPTSGITFTDTPTGEKAAVFEVLAVAFGDNGVPVDQLAKSYTLTLRKDRYEEFMKRGFVYDLAFPIKKPGAYQLRIAIKDSATNKLGSASQYVEVPNLKKKRLVLSGVALENTSFETYQKRNSSSAAVDAGSNPLIDTALRQFKPGTVLNFGFAIHNFKLPANLTSQVILYKDGKEVYAGPVRALSAPAGPDGSIPFLSSLSLADKMQPGDYALRIDITDNNVKGKYKIVTQFVQFEIVE